MKLTFSRKLSFWLRRIPINKLLRISDALLSYHCPHTLNDLVCHFMAGGDLDLIAEAVEELSFNHIEFQLIELFAFDLAGKDLKKTVAIWIEHKSHPNFNMSEYIFLEERKS